MTEKFLRPALATVCLLTLSACAGGPDEARLKARGERPLSQSQLEYLYGQTRHARLVTPYADGEVRFWKNSGQAVFVSAPTPRGDTPGHPVEGRWWIDGDTLCLELPGVIPGEGGVCLRQYASAERDYQMFATGSGRYAGYLSFDKIDLDLQERIFGRDTPPE